jgi:hypothetical protein
MSVTKVQTETIYNVEFNDVEYSVIHCEDTNLGAVSWDVFDDAGFLLQDADALPIIELVIEHMDDGGDFAFA